jgi:hypothetical protein
MTRTDTHRPSAINIEDYEFVAQEYMKTDGDIIGAAFAQRENRETIRRHMAATGGSYSHHEHGGNCGVCGSVNAIYTVLFYHIPTNTYVRTGQDCAEQIDAGLVPAMRAFRANTQAAREAGRGRAKAETILTDAGLAAAWVEFARDYNTHPALITRLGEDGKLAWSGLPREEATIREMVGNLVKYGNISPKALDYLRILLGRIENRAEIEAQRAAEKAAAAPCPTGRVVVNGTVVKVEERESAFGLTWKMTVKADEGFLVWCTVPSGLDAKRGEKVTFKATITPSDSDPKFGFGSRPAAA